MKGRAFAAVVLSALLLLSGLGIGGWWLLWQRGPLQLAHHPLALPRAARFVPASASFSLYLFSDGQRPVDYARAVAPARQRRPAGEAIARLRDGAFAAAGLDYQDELAGWLGDDIAMALFEDPVAAATGSPAQPARGWLLALASRDDDGARRFLQRFWQTRSLAGTDLQVSRYRGMGLISGRGALLGNRPEPLATALVDDDLVLIASGRNLLERALDVSQIAELNQAGQPLLRQGVAAFSSGAALAVASPQALQSWLGLPELDALTAAPAAAAAPPQAPSTPAAPAAAPPASGTAPGEGVSTQAGPGVPGRRGRTAQGGSSPVQSSDRAGAASPEPDASTASPPSAAVTLPDRSGVEASAAPGASVPAAAPSASTDPVARPAAPSGRAASTAGSAVAGDSVPSPRATGSGPAGSADSPAPAAESSEPPVAMGAARGSVASTSAAPAAETPAPASAAAPRTPAVPEPSSAEPAPQAPGEPEAAAGEPSSGSEAAAAGAPSPVATTGPQDQPEEYDLPGEPGVAVAPGPAAAPLPGDRSAPAALPRRAPWAARPAIALTPAAAPQPAPASASLLAVLQPQGRQLELRARLLLPRAPQLTAAQPELVEPLLAALRGSPSSLAVIQDPAALSRQPLLAPLLERSLGLRPLLAAERQGPLPPLLARSLQGPLLASQSAEGWQLASRAGDPAPADLEPLLSQAGLLEAPLAFEGHSLRVWTHLSLPARSGRRERGAGDALLAPLAGWREQRQELAWWGQTLAALDAPAESRALGVLRGRLRDLGRPQAPLQLSLDADAALGLLRSWQPWRLLSALAGGGLDGPVQGLALAVESPPQTSALELRARLDLGA